MSFFYFAKILAYLTVASCLIPFSSIAILTYKRGLSLFNPLLIYFASTFVIEVISVILSWNSISNLWLYQIQSVIEFGIFLFLFFEFADKRWVQLLIFSFGAIFLMLLVLEVVQISSLQSINPYSRKFEAISLVFLAVIGFLHLLQHAETTRIVSLPHFWLLVAILVYFSGSLFLFLFSEFLAKKSLEYFGIVYSIHSILNVFFNILLTVHIFKKHSWN